MSLASKVPFWSETAILLGAGATASLGVPTTEQMGKTIYRLAEENGDINLLERIKAVYAFRGIEKELECFLSVLGDDLRNDGVNLGEDSMINAKKILPNEFSIEQTKTRILQWMTNYDWNALRRLAKKVPIERNEYGRYLIDLYNIIDGSLLNNHGIQVQGIPNNDPMFLFPYRLKAARNLLILLSNLMMACAYHKVVKDNPEIFEPYIKFIETLYDLMQKETVDLENLKYNMRDFYLMSYSIVSFNFEPIFLWFRFFINFVFSQTF